MGIKVIPLSEGAFTIDKTKRFVPFDVTKDRLQERPLGSLLVEVQPFVVVTSKDVLLLDTGLGFFNRDGTLQIHQNLINNNINPLDITKVLLSHLHKDHAGGISREDSLLSKQFISFPNATYYVNRNEFDYALSMGAPSYLTEEFTLLNQFSNVKFTSDQGLIDDYIEHKVTGGHSPFHQVFWIRLEGKTIFFGADDAPQLQQMKSRFVAKYDHDGKRCMELRRQWWEKGRDERWTFLFYHDIESPVFESSI